MGFSLLLSAQPDEYNPDPQSVLQLIRKEKIKHVLPLAMRNNNVDMWIHVTRAGDPDPLEYEFGSTSGYLIFTDLGDRIEKAVFATQGVSKSTYKTTTFKNVMYIYCS